MTEIPAVHPWPTNGHLIADVASLYLHPDDTVLDATYGRGGFWTEYRPPNLITNDLNGLLMAEYTHDFRNLGFDANTFDVVAFDPPYKLSGTPALGDFDNRYGIDEPATRTDRLALISDGFIECMRISKRLVLAKCQDQVNGGRIHWQTHMLHQAAYNSYSDWRLLDRFDMIGTSRPQPSGTRQVHARGRGSTLMVFGK